MKLWRIWQNEVRGYDTYDSAIVAAETEDAARETRPGEYTTSNTWPTQTHYVYVEYLGEAKPEIEAGVILASFNAG